MLGAEAELRQQGADLAAVGVARARARRTTSTTGSSVSSRSAAGRSRRRGPGSRGDPAAVEREVDRASPRAGWTCRCRCRRRARSGRPGRPSGRPGRAGSRHGPPRPVEGRRPPRLRRARRRSSSAAPTPCAAAPPPPAGRPRVFSRADFAPWRSARALNFSRRCLSGSSPASHLRRPFAAQSARCRACVTRRSRAPAYSSNASRACRRSSSRRCHEVGVVARVVADPLLGQVELDDRGGDAVEEGAVVAGDQDRAGVPGHEVGHQGAGRGRRGCWSARRAAARRTC